MKKMIAIMMAGTLVLGTSVFAFATDNLGNYDGNDTWNANGDVTVTVDDTEAVPVYYVDVEWEELSFTYTFDGTEEWNPLDHSYGTGTGSGWSAEKTITVTNHSNTDVAGTVDFENAETSGTSKTVDGVYATLDETSFSLDTGVGVLYEDADYQEFNVTPQGIPVLEDTNTSITVDTVIVTLTKPSTT